MREKIIRYKTVSILKKLDCVRFTLIALSLWNSKGKINFEEAQKAHNEHMQYDPEQCSCVKQTLLFSENYMKSKGFYLEPSVQFSDDTKNSFSGYYFMYFNFFDLSNHVEAVQIIQPREGNDSEFRVVQNTRGKPEMPITEFINGEKDELTEPKEECKRVLLFKFQLNN